jgi:hypothetical protein
MSAQSNARGWVPAEMGDDGKVRVSNVLRGDSSINYNITRSGPAQVHEGLLSEYVGEREDDDNPEYKHDELD